MAIASMVVALGLVGCPSDGGARREAPATTTPAPIDSLPATFRYGDLVATEHHVVRIPRPGDPEVLGVLRAVDLDDGHEVEVDPVPTLPGHSTSISHVVGRADDVLVSLVVCRLPEVENDCIDGRNLLRLLDPATGRWRSTKLPDGVGDADLRSIDLLEPLPEGGAVAEASVGRDRGSIVLVLEGNRWRAVGEPVDGWRGSACATDTEVLETRKDPAPRPPGDRPQRPGASFEVRARSLATGAVRHLGAPEIDGSSGGLGVELACGDEQVAIATKGPGLGGIGRFFVLQASGWEEADGLFDRLGAVVPTETWPGSPQPLVGLAGMFEPIPLTLATVGPDGAPALIDTDCGLQECEVLPLGTGDQLLVMGPSTPATELDEHPDAGVPIPIRRIDLG